MTNNELIDQEPNRHAGFELQPRLIGDLLEVRPLREEDWERLFRVASDPLIWEQHPAHDRYKEEIFREFFREALESGGALAVIDRESRQIIGSSRYFGFDPKESEIEIGWTFLSRSHWGGTYNAELKRLMLEHAFNFVESVVFLIGPTNVRSQKAIEKIGGIKTELRRTSNLQGKAVEHDVYRIEKPNPFGSTQTLS